MNQLLQKIKSFLHIDEKNFEDNFAEDYNVFYYYDSKTNIWKIEIFDYDMELVDSFHVEDKYLDKTLRKLKTIFKINLIEQK